jgi:putative hydrolase of the HAD superfamily
VSNFDARLGPLLEDLGVRRLVDAVVCSSHAGSAKPDPAIFGAALAALDVPASATLHAGDDPVADVLGARAAGLSAVLVCRSGTLPALPPDVAAIASLAGLLAVAAET